MYECVSMCVCDSLRYNDTPSSVRHYTSNIKRKPIQQSVNTNKSRLVCVLESTEAVRAVSQSALA